MRFARQEYCSGLLLLTLDEGYLLTAAPPDLERGVAPLGLPAPMQLPLDVGLLLSAQNAPYLLRNTWYQDLLVQFTEQQ